MQLFIRRVRFSVPVSALIAMSIGLTLTAVLFVSVRRVESERQKVQFQQHAALRIASVENGMSDAVEQLMVLNQLFRTVGVVSRDQFHLFTAPLLERYPQIQALSFQRIVSHANRPAFEAAMRGRERDFSLTEFIAGEQRPAANRDSYNVVDYIEPRAGNEAAIGLDTAVTGDQDQARRHSRASGRETATGLLSLAQNKGHNTGFLVVAPVYRYGAPVDTAEERQRAVIGETAAVFRVDKLVETVLAAGNLLNVPGMTVSIYAAANAEAGSLAFRHGPALSDADAPADGARTRRLLPDWLFYDRTAPIGATYDLAGHPWHIEVAQEAQAFTAAHNGSLYALLGGIMSSLLAAAYVYALVSRKDTIERVTKERTATLQFANLRLSEDLALRTRTEKSLRLRERVIEVSSNAIIICSATAPDHAIEYVNPAFEQITGYKAAEVVGFGLESLQGGNPDQRNIEEIRAALREKREGHALLRNYRKDGSAYWNDLYVAPVQDEDGVIDHFVVAQYDITAVMRFEAELEFQAKHDSLTGLANRNMLSERLADAIAAATRDDSAIWVVFLDLDRFKFVNDTLGHEAGDALLKVLAARLQATVRECDTVARLGGDEFVLVLPQRPSAGDGQGLLHRIMEAVAQPLTLAAHEFFLTCSMGVATFPCDGDSVESLTKHADIAMYRAKEMGRNSFQFYASTMSLRTLDRLSIETDLRHALERGELQVYYQPQLSLASGRIVGMEALLRWIHPVHGVIAPARFIGLAEEMGLIVPIGAWVIETACRQTRAWQLAGFRELRVAVNLSARQFTQKALEQSIADILHDTGLEAQFLELELTESMVMNDVDNAIAILRRLKALGIHISIDDFGTGYSSLSYLRRFPIDVLKIDQSFVSDLCSDPDAAAIVTAIISLAHSLRLQVIAEGVETTAQLAFLRSQNCDQMQGYYFSRPLSSEAFGLLLREGRSLHAMEDADHFETM